MYCRTWPISTGSRRAPFLVRTRNFGPERRQEFRFCVLRLGGRRYAHGPGRSLHRVPAGGPGRGRRLPPAAGPAIRCFRRGPHGPSAGPHRRSLPVAWQRNRHHGVGIAGVPGTFCWADLCTKNVDAAAISTTTPPAICTSKTTRRHGPDGAAAIEKVGHMSIIAHPQGATFALFTPAPKLRMRNFQYPPYWHQFPSCRYPLSSRIRANAGLFVPDCCQEGLLSPGTSRARRCRVL
jgi:hypothetical protein